jgi:hypothetical protein
MITPRPYQIQNADKACRLLQEYGIAYLSMEVRTGKSITALLTADKYFTERGGSKGKRVLCLTKKKAIASIQEDYIALYGAQDSFALTVTNYEQLAKLKDVESYDLIICDEAHCLGQFPKPADRTKYLKQVCSGKPVMFLSGTPTPESLSQIYHQLWVSSFSPFRGYHNFYAWASEFVFKEERSINGLDVPDYSMNSGATIRALEANIRKIKIPLPLQEAYQGEIAQKLALVQRHRADIERVRKDIADHKARIQAGFQHLLVAFSQKDAGFEQAVQEEVLTIAMLPHTYALANMLLKDRIVIGRDGSEVLGDTEVKLKQKLHQIYSGTVLTEEGEMKVFDTTKADAIVTHFEGQKIAIFYKFRAEFELLKSKFGDRLTDSPEVFRDAGPERIFCAQIQSGREGINLSSADCLVMYNIDYSSLSYTQARARLQTQDKTAACKLYWLFAEGGIESHIYEVVKKKQDYSLWYFRKDYHIQKTTEAKNV